jgi:putative intracellular protease/amidase
MERPLEAKPRVLEVYHNTAICHCTVLLYEDGSTEFIEGRPCVGFVDRTEHCKQLHRTIMIRLATAYFLTVQHAENRETD